MYIQLQKTDSTLILAFGLENIVDFTSSVIVLWRFYCPHGCDETKMAKLKKREERASVAISIVIGLLGVFVLCTAIYDFTQNDDEQDLALLFVVSFVSIVVFGGLTIIKFQYAKKLDSPSLYKDGICSLIGTSLSASLLLTTAIIEQTPKAEYLDPVVSLVVGLCAIVYGFKVVIQLLLDGVPIFHPEWWYEKKKDVESEEGTDDVECQNSDKEQEMPSKSKEENRANETVVIEDKKKDIERQLV
jgi:divalent metal cation (Fe/Co/Zn/Cd) transporter